MEGMSAYEFIRTVSEEGDPIFDIFDHETGEPTVRQLLGFNDHEHMNLCKEI